MLKWTFREKVHVSQKLRSIIFLEEGKGGYSLEQLTEAFDKVKDENHWKNPIDAIVPSDQKDILEKAIPWFTGTEAVFEKCKKDGHLRVTAPGYFAGPCC